MTLLHTTGWHHPCYEALLCEPLSPSANSTSTYLRLGRHSTLEFHLLRMLTIFFLNILCLLFKNSVTTERTEKLKKIFPCSRHFVIYLFIYNTLLSIFPTWGCRYSDETADAVSDLKLLINIVGLSDVYPFRMLL